MKAPRLYTDFGFQTCAGLLFGTLLRAEAIPVAEIFSDDGRALVAAGYLEVSLGCAGAVVAKATPEGLRAYALQIHCGCAERARNNPVSMTGFVLSASKETD